MAKTLGKRALAIAAHPDDIEFVMAGTLILLRRAGYEIHYLNLANGCCGSTTTNASETAAIRKQEAMAAAASIGAVFHPSLVNDLEVFYNQETLERLAAIVRSVGPEILLVHAPSDYMEDHTNACRLAVTAAFVRGMPNYVTSPLTAPVDLPITVYHAQPHGNRDPLGASVRPGIFVDIGSVMPEKAAMLDCHKSQNAWLDASQSLSSCVSKMTELMQEVGRMSGRFEVAEGWRKHLHLGFCNEGDDPLVDALGSAAWREE